MEEKKKRRYDSSSRQRQAEQNRQTILDRARDLLAAEGFDGMTIDAVAKAAGVSTPTVYALFGAKKGILAAILDGVRFGGDYEGLVHKAISEPDPHVRLGYAAAIARQIYDSERGMLDLLAGAGVVSSELSQLLREKETSRFDTQSRLIDLIHQSGKLSPRISLEEAKDVFWTLTGRDLYRMLVIERGWSSARYEAWLGMALAQSIAING